MVVLSKEGCQRTSIHEENRMKRHGRQMFSYDNVHIYFINPKEEGATQRETTTVRLVISPLNDQNSPSDFVIPPAFLEAGGWFYPLIPSKTPVYRTQEKYYVFPDLLSPSKGSSVGIVFPASITTDERDLFEDILLNLAGLDEFPNSFAEELENSGGLITSIDTVYDISDASEPMEAEFLTKSARENIVGGSVTGGATKSLHFNTYGTVSEKSHTNSNVETAKEYTEKAIEISGHAVSTLTEATLNLAVFSAYYLTLAASSAMGAIHEGTSAIGNDIFSATDGAMHAMGFVYKALHDAGRTLANSIAH